MPGYPNAERVFRNAKEAGSTSFDQLPEVMIINLLRKVTAHPSFSKQFSSAEERGTTIDLPALPDANFYLHGINHRFIDNVGDYVKSHYSKPEPTPVGNAHEGQRWAYPPFDGLDKGEVVVAREANQATKDRYKDHPHGHEAREFFSISHYAPINTRRGRTPEKILLGHGTFLGRVNANVDFYMMLTKLLGGGFMVEYFQIIYSPSGEIESRPSYKFGLTKTGKVMNDGDFVRKTAHLD